MSNARNLARLIVDSGGDLDAGNLGNAPNPINAGTVAYLGMSTAPTGWLKANGAAISRTTYAALFTAIGTAYGTGDGSTTFNIPDLRGEFPRGFDDGRGIDSGRVFGSAQSDSLQDITGTLLDASAGTVGLHGSGTTGAFTMGSQSTTYRQALEVGSGGKIIFDASRVARTASETRGRNIALLACIKY